MAILRLNDAHVASLTTMIRDGYPHETCGVLIGRQADGAAEVVRVAQARNLNTERAADRFDLDPADFMRADEQARRDGLEIIGIWHSHPDHPAKPSQTDLEAAWPGWSYLIASVSEGGIEDMTSWRLDEDGKAFIQETIEQ